MDAKSSKKKYDDLDDLVADAMAEAASFPTEGASNKPRFTFANGVDLFAFSDAMKRRGDESDNLQQLFEEKYVLTMPRTPQKPKTMGEAIAETQRRSVEEARARKNALDEAKRRAKEERARAQREAHRKAEAEMDKRAEAYRQELAAKARREAADAEFERRAAEVRAEQAARQQETIDIGTSTPTPSAPEAKTTVVVETRANPTSAMTFEERAEAYRQAQLKKIEDEIAAMKAEEEAFTNEVREREELNALARLRACISDDDVEALETMLTTDKYAADVINRNDPDNHEHPRGSALHFAIIRLVSPLVIECLIKHGANVNQAVIAMPLTLDPWKFTRDKLTPLFRVVWECLVQDTLLPEYLDLLVKAGADLSTLGPSVYETLVNMDPTHEYEPFVPEGYEYRPSLLVYTIAAITLKKKDGVVCTMMKKIRDLCESKKIAIELEPDYHTQDFMPLLHIAVKFKLRRVVKLLIKMGVDIHSKIAIESPSHGIQQVTALDVAMAMHDEAEMVYLLCRAGALADATVKVALPPSDDLRSAIERAHLRQIVCMHQGHREHVKRCRVQTQTD